MKSLVAVFFLTMAPGLLAQDGGGDVLEYFPQQLTASRMLFYCAGSSLTSSGRERVKTCAGFVSGVEEAVRLLESRGLLKEPSGICVPEGTPSSMFAQAFRRYAVKETGTDKPAAEVAIQVLKQAYPCE